MERRSPHVEQRCRVCGRPVDPGREVFLFLADGWYHGLCFLLQSAVQRPTRRR